jgi:hypothetical protein
MAKKDETDFKENLKKKPSEDEETDQGAEKDEEYVKKEKGSIEGGKDKGDFEGKKKEVAKKMGDCAKCGSRKHKTKDHK